MSRIFIGISITQEIKDEVRSIQSKLRQSELFTGSFIRPDNLHLTLKFLGDLNEDDILKIQENLSKIVFHSIRLESTELSFFGHEFIKVIWLGFNSNTEKLETLKQQIDESVEWLDKKDKTNFLSHLTIARVKSVKDKEKLEQLISEIKIKKLELNIDHFSLISSQLTQNGPVYTELARYEAN